MVGRVTFSNSVTLQLSSLVASFLSLFLSLFFVSFSSVPLFLLFHSQREKKEKKMFRRAGTLTVDPVPRFPRPLLHQCIPSTTNELIALQLIRLIPGSCRPARYLITGAAGSASPLAEILHTMGPPSSPSPPSLPSPATGMPL